MEKQSKNQLIIWWSHEREYSRCCPSTVECRRTEWRQCVSIFANTCHKSVTIATSLKRAVAIRIFYY